MLTELESEDFQQKSIAGVFKDPSLTSHETMDIHRKGRAALGMLTKGKSTGLTKDTSTLWCFH